MAKNIPFRFVFDYLQSADITVRPMFGMHAVYVNEKIMLVLRQGKVNRGKNGVWIATEQKHHKSLKEELPSLSSIFDYSKTTRQAQWQILPSSADDFEASVIKVCAMITRGDPRIGRIPKSEKLKVKS